MMLTIKREVGEKNCVENLDWNWEDNLSYAVFLFIYSYLNNLTCKSLKFLYQQSYPE